MANEKGLAMQQTIRMLSEQGRSQREIARTLGISRNTVARYVPDTAAPTAETEPPARKVPTGADVQTEPPPAKVPTGSVALPATVEDAGDSIPARSQSKCLPFREIIEEKIELGLHARRIHQDLVHEHGFEDGYDSVKRFVRRLTATAGMPHRRMETAPGAEAQVDFGKGARVEGEDGRRRKTHMLRVVLSHSRGAYSEVMWRQNTESLIRALENAFRHLGGVPVALVPDNMKAAVLLADKYDPELNPKFKSFADHYHVAVLPTPPRRPELKGKVENSVGYAFKGALKGLTFRSLAAQNERLRWWEANIADTRIHGTTQKQVRAALEAERPFLQPLPAMLFPVFQEGKRTVHRDGHVEVAKSYYSAPPEFVGRQVWVRWDGRVVRIFHPSDFRMVRMHAQVEPGKFATCGDDIPACRISSLERGDDFLLQELERIDPHVHAWALAMVQVRGLYGVRVLQGLRNLARKTDRSALSRACRQALELQAWRLQEIRRLVENPPEEQPELALTQDHPMIRDLADYGALVRPFNDGSET